MKKTYRIYAEVVGVNPYVEIDIEADGPEDAKAEFMRRASNDQVAWVYPDAAWNGEVEVQEILDTTDEV